jgi:Na+-driven multidrug efflux pump
LRLTVLPPLGLTWTVTRCLRALATARLPLRVSLTATVVLLPALIR